VQVDDKGAGKKKGFVDSLPPGRELEADRGKALNPETVHSDLDDIVTLGLPPGQELQPDRGMTLNLQTVHSDLDDIVTLGLPPGQKLQADSGAGALNPETIHSDLDNIVPLGLPPGQELQPDRGMTLNIETVHSDLDDIAPIGLTRDLELNLDRGKSLPAGWQTIVPDTGDTPATALPNRWELGDDRAKMLPSTNPELEDDDDGWRLVPYFGILLVFFSWIVQSGLGAIKRKAARLKFEPNALRSTGSVNGPRRFMFEDQFKPSVVPPPALDKFPAAFSIAGERQQKAADEKTPALEEHFSGYPDVEKARAEFKHAQQIEETFHKDFDGGGLS
jgi:hypothetical protein